LDDAGARPDFSRATGVLCQIATVRELHAQRHLSLEHGIAGTD
jgi:hypothetical protein